MKKKHRIAPEVKEQILRRIKEEGITVAQAEKDHGVSNVTIYKWLGRSAEAGPTWAQYNKLKRENQALKELVGELTFDLNTSQKRGS